MGTSGKCKVMHVLKSSVYSGAENVVITIMERLADEFDFLYVATEGPVRKILEERQIPFRLMKTFSWTQLRRTVREVQPDVIHAHDFSATVMCAMLPGKYRLISHLHYDPPWVKRWNAKTWIYAFCHRKMEKLLTVSDRMFEAMVFADRFRDKHVTVGNPVDGERIRRLAEEPMEESGTDQAGRERRCDVIFVGRLVEQKDPQRFIRLMARLREEGRPELFSWMLGDGELRTECETLIQRLGMTEHIELKGFCRNPYPYMKRAAILCVTSGWEGFGLVAAEANLLEIPVLSTANSGCTEIFGADAPEICRSDDEFTDKLQMLLSSPDERKAWKERMRDRVKRLDNMNDYMTFLSAVYRNEDLT